MECRGMRTIHVVLVGLLAVLFVALNEVKGQEPRILADSSSDRHEPSYSVVTSVSSSSTSARMNKDKDSKTKSGKPKDKYSGTKIYSYSKNGVIESEKYSPDKISQKEVITKGITKDEIPVPMSKITVLYDTSGIDSDYQMELLSAVYTALKDLHQNDLDPQYIDIGSINTPSTSITSDSRLVTSAQWIVNNRTTTIISLLEPEMLSEFTKIYDQMKARRVLKIVSPRLVRKNVFAPNSIEILCLQMSETAMATALLNRVEKIKVKTLIPVLDKGNAAQLELLDSFIQAGGHRMEPIEYGTPIFVTPGERNPTLRYILNDEQHVTAQHTGILMLAMEASQSVMDVANEANNFLQMRWFSPNFLQYEEWAGRNSKEGQNNNNNNNNATFGIYSTLFVGSSGWDNPTRRKTLRELSSQSDASPRVLSSILAYDAAWVARNHIKNELSLPMEGLSGEITFDSEGYRREGQYFGISAVPQLVSPSVALLQPSNWILEEVLSVTETLEGQYLITDYTVATSSMLTKEELLNFAEQTANSSDCREHLMEIVTHDPFNQRPSSYSFKKENLPHHLLIPNQHGYGITFKCQHHHQNQSASEDVVETTLRLACTPGGRFNDPVKCFRSHLKLKERRKRWANSERESRNYYYYPGDNNQFYSRSGQQQYAFPRDDSYLMPPSQQGIPQPVYSHSSDSSTVATMTSRIITISEDSTPAPSPAPTPAPKPLPELRQVLKAAKPFVGSCVGAATGCSMCVLVLGRLPLGTLPPACTGPCFVGVFGSCGALLGRAFSETTVICTELFKQGYLDVDTFLADAEFGRRLNEESPMTLKGYQILATPLVEKMRKSKAWTEFVSKFAVPWAKQMKYSMGYSEEFDWIGYLLNLVGSPICFAVGVVHSLLWSSSAHNQKMGNIFSTDSIFTNGSSNSLSVTALLILTFISLLAHHLISSVKSRRKIISWR